MYLGLTLLSNQTKINGTFIDNKLLVTHRQNKDFFQKKTCLRDLNRQEELIECVLHFNNINNFFRMYSENRLLRNQTKINGT